MSRAETIYDARRRIAQQADQQAASARLSVTARRLGAEAANHRLIAKARTLSSEKSISFRKALGIVHSEFPKLSMLARGVMELEIGETLDAVDRPTTHPVASMPDTTKLQRSLADAIGRRSGAANRPTRQYVQPEAPPAIPTESERQEASNIFDRLSRERASRLKIELDVARRDVAATHLRLMEIIDGKQSLGFYRRQYMDSFRT